MPPFYVDRAIASGTNMVGGVTPGKGGTRHLGLPVFNTVAEASRETAASATVIFVPRENAKSAILEAVDAGLELIVCITEHIPVRDMLEVSAALEHGRVARGVTARAEGSDVGLVARRTSGVGRGHGGQQGRGEDDGDDSVTHPSPSSNSA